MSESKKIYKYSSVLRVGEHVLYSQSQQQDLWNMLQKYKNGFDEIIFFTQMNHSVRSIIKHKKTALLMEPLLRKAESLGFRSGIDVLCTTGFFADDIDHTMDRYAPSVDINGNETPGRLCPLNSENIDFYTEQYHIYASISPNMIYIDDDISSLSCFCDDCLQRFTESYDLLYGKKISLDTLNKLFNSSDIAVRKSTRESWIDYNSTRIGEVFFAVEKAVHAVNPDIELGFMSHMCGSDGLGTDKWAEQLIGGNCSKISWRPGGGVYSEFTPNEVISKANRIGAQIRYLPDFAERVESEVENFPYQGLKKSPSFTAFESLIYLAAGCTGTTFNICSNLAPDYIEHERFFEAAAKVSEAGKLIVETFGRSAPEGVGFAWNKKSAAAIGADSWHLDIDVPFAHELSQIGIPTAYDTANTSVFFMNKSIAMQMSDDELRDILTKGVLMDTDTLNVCNSRGFEKYTGFKVKNGYSADSMERDTEHFINLSGRRIRDVRQAFGWCGTVYTIEKTFESAEYLTEIIDFRQNVRGMGSGIYENEYGGRIAIEGMLPFEWCYSMQRSVHMKNLCRWLSKDRLSAYVKSFHRMALWARKNGAFLANISMEEINNAELALLNGSNEIEVTVFKAGVIELSYKVTQESKDNNYTFYNLPKIPMLGEVLIKF